MTPSSAKNKGRKLQQWVRDMLLQAFPHLTPDDVRSTSSGAQGEDVQLSPAARAVFPFQVECKSLARVAIYKYMAQAQSHGDHIPVVFVKQNGFEPLAIIPGFMLFEIMKAGIVLDKEANGEYL